MASTPTQRQIPFDLEQLSRASLWPLVALGLVGTGGVLYLLQSRAMLLPLMALAAMVLAVLVTIRPAIGLVAVTACAILVRVNVSTGTESPMVASLGAAAVLLVGWFIHRVLHHQRLNYLPRSVAIPGLLLVGATVFALLWGRATLDPRVPMYPSFIQVQIGATGLLIVSVALLFIGGDLLRDRRLRAALVAALIITGFVALPGRTFGFHIPLINSAGLFGLWFVALCWGNALVNRRLPDLIRVVLGIGALGWLVMAWTREGTWVTGWLPPIVALLVVTLVTRPRFGVIALIVGAVALLSYYSVLYDQVIGHEKNEGSLEGEFGRIELWKRNLEVIQGHLLFGTGPAGYALYYVTFAPDHAMSTHSNYVDTLAQTGVTGLAGLFALMVGLLRVGIRLFSKLSDSFDQAVCGAVAGGVVGVGVAMWLGDWLIPFVYNQTIAGFDHAVYSWLMFAVLCGLYAQHCDRETDDA